MAQNYEFEINTLKEQIFNMKKSIEEEREEYKKYYQYTKKTNYNSSNINQFNDSDAYVDIEYYKESVYINSLKIYINNLIKHNDDLKKKIRELTEENELLKGEFRL